MTSVRPFSISVPQSALDDLQARLRAARWPDELPDAGPADGVDPGLMHTLVERWTGGFDWRAIEAEFNVHAQVTTVIDGQTIVATHARSADPNATPIVLLHGWPSTVAEFRWLIEPLIAPPDGEPAFHVILPSLPGFGWSAPTGERGWTTARMASAIAELMARLGYSSYLTHGGDVGTHVASDLAVVDAAHVTGIHLNLSGSRSAAVHQNDESLDANQIHSLQQWRRYMSDGSGYALLQATRPQSLAYGLTDSPIGQLAWIAEKFEEWADPEHRVAHDDILIAASIYWFTRTANSSARAYQTFHRGRDSPRPYVETPTAVSVFPYDIVRPIKIWAEEMYNVVDWDEMPSGGHFSSLERPDLMVQALRRFATVV